jgi:hypothetical protein
LWSITCHFNRVNEIQNAGDTKMASINQQVAKVNSGEIKSAAVRRTWTATLAMILGLFITLGTIGCAGTRGPAGSNSMPNSAANGNTSGSDATQPSSPSAAAVLSASNNSLSFGNVQVSQSTSQPVTLSNTGSSAVTISAMQVSGAGFSISNSSLTLQPNQSANVYVNFVPTAQGAANGTLTVLSNASDAIVTIGLSGNGSTQQQSAHNVDLSWTPSSSQVTGYIVSRSTVSGGPYTQVNAAVDPNSSFTDNVTSGSYYYVVSAVDSNNNASIFSNEVQVLVP